MQNVTMVRAKSELIAVLVAQDNRYFNTVICNCPLRVEVVKPAQVCCQLNCFTVSLLKVNRVFQIVLTDFKLNPAVVAGTLWPGSTTPGFLVPVTSLNRRHISVGKFANKCVNTGFKRNPFALYPLTLTIPVVVVFVHANQLKHFGSVCCIVIWLNITLQSCVVCTGRVPQNTTDGNFASSLVP